MSCQTCNVRRSAVHSAEGDLAVFARKLARKDIVTAADLIVLADLKAVVALKRTNQADHAAECEVPA